METREQVKWGEEKKLVRLAWLFVSPWTCFLVHETIDKRDLLRVDFGTQCRIVFGYIEYTRWFIDSFKKWESYLFIYSHDFILDIYLQDWIDNRRIQKSMRASNESKFKSETKKKNRIKKEEGKNANDSAMNRNFPLILHGDILSLLLLFPIFTNVRINWQSGFLAVDRRCIRAASSRTGFLLKHEARSTASVMRSFHRVTYRLAHHSWFSISRQKTWPAFSKKKRKENTVSPVKSWLRDRLQWKSLSWIILQIRGQPPSVKI